MLKTLRYLWNKQKATSKSSRKRHDAIRALGKIGSQRAFHILAKFLDSDDRSDVFDAAYALAKLGDSRAVRPLFDTLASHSKDYFVKIAVLQSLDELGADWNDASNSDRALEALRVTIGELLATGERTWINSARELIAILRKLDSPVAKQCYIDLSAGERSTRDALEARERRDSEKRSEKHKQVLALNL